MRNYKVGIHCSMLLLMLLAKLSSQHMLMDLWLRTNYVTTQILAELLHVDNRATKFMEMSVDVLLGESEECCRGVDCSEHGLHCCKPQLKHQLQDAHPLMPDWTQRGGSLCYSRDGWLDCTPPSYRFLERWST
eukprot:2375520-Amphidinium_carterae.1